MADDPCVGLKVVLFPLFSLLFTLAHFCLFMVSFCRSEHSSACRMCITQTYNTKGTWPTYSTGKT